MLHKKLEGSKTRTADLSWPKGYFLSYDIMPIIDTGVDWGQILLPGNGHSIGVRGGEQLHCVSLVLYILLLLFIYLLCL